MGLNNTVQTTKLPIQCIMSYGMPLIHQDMANVRPPEITYKGVYSIPKINPNIPLIDAQSNGFKLFVILRVIITTDININQIYKYAIDQNPKPYIKNSSIIYIPSGYITLIPKVIAYTINSRDTGSTFGREDIANLNANSIAPNIPYKHTSLVFIFITIF